MATVCCKFQKEYLKKIIGSIIIPANFLNLIYLLNYCSAKAGPTGPFATVLIDIVRWPSTTSKWETWHAKRDHQYDT